jgi:iron(II)-dependent oxidoreductase
LYDMLGNVCEWCSSLHRPYPFDAADGRESPDGSGLRILRGGGFADPLDLLNPALRHAERPNRRLRWNGLRLARDVPEAR